MKSCVLVPLQEKSWRAGGPDVAMRKCRRWIWSVFLFHKVDHASNPRNSQSTDVDNPDQRISEDVNYFTKVTLDFLFLSVLSKHLPEVASSIVLERVAWAFMASNCTCPDLSLHALVCRTSFLMFICKRNLQLETLLPAPLLLPPYQLGGNARLDVLDSILNLISFSAILWSTSQTLTGALAIYDTWWKGCVVQYFSG